MFYWRQMIHCLVHCKNGISSFFTLISHFEGFFSAKAVFDSQAEGHCGKRSEETLRGTGVRGGWTAEKFVKAYGLGM